MDRTSVRRFVRGFAVFATAVATWVLSVDCANGIAANPGDTNGAPSGSSSSSSGGGSSSSSGAGAADASTTTTHDATAPSDSGGGAVSCASGTTLCNANCVITATDPANCGKCGDVCATGQACNAGVCGCRAGQTTCSGSCVDTTSDPKNCGACGTACATGMVCSQSKCASGCAGTLKLCGSSCVDTSGSSINCGTCGNVCPANQFCFSGVCQCAAGQGACGTNGACVDTTMSQTNCGKCGTTCATGATCVASACACPTGQIVCNGKCVDPNTDETNCGSCGTTCTTAGTQCLFGGCINPTSLDCGGGAMVGNTCTVNAADIVGEYWINNNQWGVAQSGTSGQQCMWSTCQTGDLVGWGTNWNWTNGSGGVKTYVSLVFGWQFGIKIANTGLPIQISTNPQINCGWDFTVAQTGTLDVSYDTWLHTVNVTTQPNMGSNATPSEEVMVWLYSAGGAGPIGPVVASNVSLAGTTWDLHQGPGGSTWPVSSYVRTGNATTSVMNMMVFYNDLVSRGWIPNTRYLSSIQAGTEVFSGTGSLTTNGFYCRVQ
ncbi:MAG TPA: MXAN_6577-like cysteine-rich protein [Polyangiaceae bacterium]